MSNVESEDISRYMINFPNLSLFNLKRILVQNILHNPLLPSLETVQDWCSGFERRNPQSQFTRSTSEVNILSTQLLMLVELVHF